MEDKFILKTGSSLFPKICRSYFLFTPHGLGDFLDSLSLFHCSSSVSLLPISQEAKPHCGLRQRRSSGINERIFSAAYIKEQLTGNYFVAENAVDILQHEMHHKEHWDYIRTKALTSGKSGAIVKQEIEADLREYVHNQLASDPAYIRETVSRNAANGFQRYASLNELIADALLQKDKGVAKDSVLLKLVEGVVYDDSDVR